MKHPLALKKVMTSLDALLQLCANGLFENTDVHQIVDKIIPFLKDGVPSEVQVRKERFLFSTIKLS